MNIYYEYYSFSLDPPIFPVYFFPLYLYTGCVKMVVLLQPFIKFDWVAKFFAIIENSV